MAADVFLLTPQKSHKINNYMPVQQFSCGKFLSRPFATNDHIVQVKLDWLRSLCFNVPVRAWRIFVPCDRLLQKGAKRLSLGTSRKSLGKSERNVLPACNWSLSSVTSFSSHKTGDFLDRSSTKNTQNVSERRRSSETG